MQLTICPCDIQIGITVDATFYIMSGEETIGVGGISDMEKIEEKYLEWVEIYPPYAGKHLFRNVLIAIANHFHADVFVLEANEDVKPIYEHLKAQETGYDDIREIWEYRIQVNTIPKDNLSN